MLPDLLSPLESCCQHGAEWLPLPGWQKPSACPWQQATSLRGQMQPLGMHLQMSPGKKKALPWLTTACRGTKASLKPLCPCLQIADWGSLWLFAAHKADQENCKGPLQTAVSTGLGVRGVNECHLTQIISEPERTSSETCHSFDISQSWPPFRRLVPSRCLPAAETPFGETPTVSAVEMKRRLHGFTEAQWCITLFKGPWDETVPAYIWMPWAKLP